MFSTMARMLRGGLGKYSNQWLHQLTGRGTGEGRCGRRERMGESHKASRKQAATTYVCKAGMDRGSRDGKGRCGQFCRLKGCCCTQRHLLKMYHKSDCMSTVTTQQVIIGINVRMYVHLLRTVASISKAKRRLF